MNMRKLFRHGLLALLAVGATASALAADVATDPIGYVTLTINPSSNGTTRALTVLSFPLLQTATKNGTDAIDGAIVGTFGAVTSNTVTVNSAGWTAGQLSQAGYPKLIRITSGAAVGQTFLVSTTVANTSDTLTLATSETSDLSALGIVAGTDTFKLLDCDTLSSIFHDPSTFAISANNDPNLADQVLMVINGVWNTFYFHVTNNRWQKRGFGQDATNQPIKPESAVIYNRIGTDVLSLTLTGDVPVTRRADTVKKSGLTFLGSNWPVDVTLLSSGIQNIPGWVANANVASADQVILLINGAWNTFWWTGSNWKKRGFGVISDTQPILAGTGVILSKLGVAAADSKLAQDPPY